MSLVDFESAVIQRSHALPVVVDFWAPWCGPCRILGPTIEKLADEAAGRWELVKLDTEQQPELAERFEVRGIPAVKLFHEGQVVAEFVGTMPRDEILRWLDANLPGTPEGGDLSELVQAWLVRGADAVPLLESWVAEHPESREGRLRLAQAIVPHDPARARALAREAGDNGDLIEMEQGLSDLAELAELGELGELGDGPTPRLAGSLRGAREAFSRHDLDLTLEHLIDAAMIDKDYRDGLPRRAAVALFRLVGPGHELTQKHQRRLSMALHC